MITKQQYVQYRLETTRKRLTRSLATLFLLFTTGIVVLSALFVHIINISHGVLAFFIGVLTVVALYYLGWLYGRMREPLIWRLNQVKTRLRKISSVTK